MDAVYDELHRSGRTNIVLVGDSAGGGLALALCQRWKAQGRPLSAGLALLSPWLDVSVGDPRQPMIEARDPILSIDRLRAAGRAWAGTLPTDHPAASPLFGSLDGLPPMSVHTGSDDLLYADATRLAELTGTAGTRLDVHDYPGMFHVWMAAPIPEAKRALREVAAFCRECLDARA